MISSLRARLAALTNAAADALAPAPRAALDARPEQSNGSVPREVLRQVRRIELQTRGWVDSLFGGEYHSVFKGQGMEFSEVREYQVGDEVRVIDWNVTARTGHPYVKKYVEERELTVVLAVDLSGSEQFGTRGRFKAELAAEIAAVLALSAVRNNDRVGLLILTEEVEHFVPPRKGRRHVLRLIRDVLAYRPRRTGTDLAAGLDYLSRVLRQRAIIFLLSDFHLPDGAAGDGLERGLRLAAGRHDLIAVRTVDAGEETMPNAGLLALADPETGEEVVVDTSGRRLRAGYAERLEQETLELRRLLRRLGIDEIVVRTDASYIDPLLAFFHRRERRARR